jgi:hypothetical protein
MGSSVYAFEQRAPHAECYPFRMTLKNVKLTLAVAYAIGVGGVAVATGATSPAGLVVFAALALLPAAALVALWNDPPQTLSEAIQSQTARR